ncbi:MAG: NADH-quinone oxidoreductase subunit NuoE [Ignavibacteriae bacterium]|nr:NADH-quinone oxidoreductase subunit NuoE [Ignavibacteria bacterium]MBI3364917.1 NADH-quinone oxidoreductase subunit NuoE [Ignavibacteriota bacterium]
MLSKENFEKLERLKSQYPTTKSLSLPVLWMIQEQHGWISPESMQYVADLLQLPVSHVYGVVTFYTMFNTKPVGKYHLQVCTNVSCLLRGGEELLDHICKRLHVKRGEITLDQRFTVTEVECLGSCGTAPMLQANDEYYENLSTEKVERLLDEWSKG